MIKYHGMPITPVTAAVAALQGGAGFVSYANPEQLDLALECCAMVAVDNGAFPDWKAGKPRTNWSPYYEWLEPLLSHPAFQWAIIPDVINGDQEENIALIQGWPYGHKGVPVWHLHESLEWLKILVATWPRIAIGSSGQYAQVGAPNWWQRMDEAMRVICDDQGRPKTRIHGLRMLSTKIFTKFPFASADSTNIARNIGICSRWARAYAPAKNHKPARAMIIRQRIEAFQSPPRYEFQLPVQEVSTNSEEY